MTTLFALVIFRPTPPARVDMRKMNDCGEVLKVKTALTPAK